MKSRNCPICGCSALSDDDHKFPADYIECNICNEYIIDLNIIKHEIEPKLRSCMYFYLTQNILNNKLARTSENKLIPYFCSFVNFEEKINQNRYFISKDSLYNIYPNTISELIDKILLNLAHLSNGIGNYIEIDYENYTLIKNIFFIVDNEENIAHSKIKNIAEMLVQSNYISAVNFTTTNFRCKLTSVGWKRIEKIQNENKVIKQAFVAMWFDKEMKPTQDVIIKVIEGCGYVPMIINQKEHNNQIVPEIFYEIKRSLFVVADLCGHRGGVYYEAGYAEALGKEVIIICSEVQHKKAHFDIKQKSAVIYKDNEDLENRLKERIKVTIGLNK